MQNKRPRHGFDEQKNYRIRVTEKRSYEFMVRAGDKEDALKAGIKAWCCADTVGQWEVRDSTEYEYEAELGA